MRTAEQMLFVGRRRESGSRAALLQRSNPTAAASLALPHAEASSAAAAEGGGLSRGRAPQPALSSVPLTPRSALCRKARKRDVPCAARQPDAPAEAGYGTAFGFAKEAAL